MRRECEEMLRDGAAAMALLVDRQRARGGTTAAQMRDAESAIITYVDGLKAAGVAMASALSIMAPVFRAMLALSQESGVALSEEMTSLAKFLPLIERVNDFNRRAAELRALASADDLPTC